MKKALLIVLVGLFSLQSFGQDPNLFRTWYLYTLDVDLGNFYMISDINPSISPFITISEDLSFSGEGACNTYEGAFNYIEPLYLETLTFSNTIDDCEIHNSFENDFFEFFLEGFEFHITEESEGLSLHFSTVLMSYALFKDFPLSVIDNTLTSIKIYPNPTSDQLFIFSENTVIERFTIFSLTGKKILEALNENNSIDVSTLSKGIYFIELSSSEGKSIQRFIKY